MEESGGRGKGLSSLRGGGGKAMEAASAEAAEAEATAEGGGDTSFPFYMPGARAGGGRHTHRKGMDGGGAVHVVY